mmetsp:Transcript_58840/g.120391  ORF Transcript_58840/g.120391 Transcript_58840/m.120391 type:complete len:127 (+) Transcript_58840:198-578(+)
MRQPKIVEELLSQRDAGAVELEFGEFGVSGQGVCISKIKFVDSATAVFDALNRCINCPPQDGKLHDNMRQCLKDCAVVPKNKSGRNYSWTAHVGCVWEFSKEVRKKRLHRLEAQYRMQREKRLAER